MDFRTSTFVCHLCSCFTQTVFTYLIFTVISMRGPLYVEPTVLNCFPCENSIPLSRFSSELSVKRMGELFTSRTRSGFRVHSKVRNHTHIILEV
jgi:hypothetical protein